MNYRAARAVAALAAAAGLLAGCSGGTAKAQDPQAAPLPATPATPVRPSTPAPCPVVKTPPAKFPAEVPADLPKPPTATITKVDRTKDGITVVRFTTAASLREGVLYLVKALPKAGFVLGRGDAETFEADAPFVRGDVRGTYRIVSRDTCQADWLLAVVKVKSSGTPVLPLATPSGSPTPLPFG